MYKHHRKCTSNQETESQNNRKFSRQGNWDPVRNVTKHTYKKATQYSDSSKKPSCFSVCQIQLCFCLSHILASSLHAHCCRQRCKRGKQPTFALSLIFWPNTKDIATSASFFSIPPPSLLPLAPSSSFSCFWNGNQKNSTRSALHFFFYMAILQQYFSALNRIKAYLLTNVTSNTAILTNICITFCEYYTQYTSITKRCMKTSSSANDPQLYTFPHSLMS